MKVLQLDLSTKSTGWSVYDGTKLLDHGCITASSADVIKRIYKVADEVKKIIEQYSDIEKVIAEEVIPEGGGKNAHTYKVLMWLQAQINFVLHDNFPKVTMEYILPNSWRSKCGIHTGRGIKRDQLKQADIDFVWTTYCVKVNDDEADAIAIGHQYTYEHQDDEGWNWE